MAIIRVVPPAARSPLPVAQPVLEKLFKPYRRRKLPRSEVGAVELAVDRIAEQEGGEPSLPSLTVEGTAAVLQGGDLHPTRFTPLSAAPV